MVDIESDFTIPNAPDTSKLTDISHRVITSSRQKTLSSSIDERTFSRRKTQLITVQVEQS